MLKVLYMAHLDPFVAQGGGEAITRSLIEHGRQRGHQVQVISAREHSLHRSSFDLAILADLYNQPFSLRARLPDSLIDAVVNHMPYIHIDNAYVDVCHQDYFPCNGDVAGTQCPFQHGHSRSIVRMIESVIPIRHRRFSTSLCMRTFTRPIYERAAVNVFLSPLHRDRITRLLQLPPAIPTLVLNPIIDRKKFFNRGIPRDIENLFCGVISEAKGFYQLRERFPEGNIVLVGARRPDIDPIFGKQVGPVPYDDIPIWMNRARNFVYLPRWPEPQGRVVVEAALCGCNLVLNENVGAASFPFPLSNPDAWENGDHQFWDFVEETF